MNPHGHEAWRKHARACYQIVQAAKMGVLRLQPDQHPSQAARVREAMMELQAYLEATPKWVYNWREYERAQRDSQPASVPEVGRRAAGDTSPTEQPA